MDAFADAPPRAATGPFEGLLLLLPGALTVYLSFNAGGFFPNTSAFVGVILVGVLVLRILLTSAPFEGFSPLVAVAAGALALYAAWTAVSGIWSDAFGRSLIETDRVLLYLVALVLFGFIPRRAEGIRWMVRGLAAGIVIVCVIALITRVLPDVWPIGPNLAADRLSYPLTYWNALGFLASLGIIFCFHITCSLSEHPLARVFASGALPALGAALLFTYSRGGMAAGIIGLVAYVVIARPRGLISGLLAAGPATAASIVSAYHADLLASNDPTSSAATAQGHDVALVVGVCIGAAILLRFLLLLVDDRLETFRVRPDLRRPVFASTAAAALLVVIVGSLALHVPNSIADQYDRFVQGNNVGGGSDIRTRLTDPGNNGRIRQWKVAIDEFDREPLRGTGAGTYKLSWEQHRPLVGSVTDAHSLYVEVLGELGVVGAALLVLALGTLLVGIAIRLRGPNRTVYGALLAAGLAWIFHAGVDWDWEMPAVTLWLFALGGAALARPALNDAATSSLGLPLRGVIAAACLPLAILPVLVFLSEGRLNDSLDHFSAKDCPAAISSARSSISALGSRAEPYEVLAYCDFRRSFVLDGLKDIKKAVKRDPNDWNYRLDLALFRAAAGLDPRPAARKAFQLNPLEPSTSDAVRRFRSGDPGVWKRQGRRLIAPAFQ